MKRWTPLTVLFGLLVIVAAAPLRAGAEIPAAEIDRILAEENAERGVTLAPLDVVGDLAYLRRVYIDLAGRIPTYGEVESFLQRPAATRRAEIVDELLQDERFADKWTVFYADMLRIRSNSEGGGQLMAYVHRAVSEGMPYDELCRKLISTNGKVGTTPEVGFILGDEADPMALAGVTSQVFLGVRIACAQCHDHPFDVWTREDFYGFAAYFGKTRRYQRRFNNRILATYTTDIAQTSVLWPPEGAGEEADRKPMKPEFPFEIAEGEERASHVVRLAALRQEQKRALAVAKKESDAPGIDDLLTDAADKARRQTSGGLFDPVADEARKAVESIDIKAGGYADSELRIQLAELITSPQNRYFSRCFVNRVWNELVGNGIVNPIDDFSAGNQPSHPRTLDYLADEFVANGYDLRALVRAIVLSDAYQRKHYTGADEARRQDLEQAFLATPFRRMISEVLYDSIVAAGHLFEPKHSAGRNLKVVWRESRIMKQPGREQAVVKPKSLAGGSQPAMKAMAAGEKPKAGSGYSLENAIELDFESLLKSQEDGVEIEAMAVMSAEELEAQRMQQQMQRRTADYIDRYARETIDDNPQFATSLRMASPAAPGHFLRVFGQPGRSELGETRDSSPTMRQSLMMLNGRLTHEASRVGDLEPVHGMLVGKTSDVRRAVARVYMEILTRKPSESEVEAAVEIISANDSLLAGMADFRWVLLNGNEFRFLP